MIQQYPQRDSQYILLLLQMGNEFENISLDTSEKYYREALQLSIDLGSLFMEGKTISWFTDVLNKKGLLDESATLNRRGVAIGRMLNHPRLLAASLANLANTFQFSATHDSTLKYQLEALPVLEQLGDSVFIAAALNNISGSYQLLRRYSDALPYAERARDIAMRRDDGASEAASLISIAIIHHASGRSDEALSHFHEALQVAERHNLAYEKGVALLNLAEQHQDMGRSLQALRYVEQGMGIMQEMQEKDILSRLLYTGGDVRLDLKRYPEADVWLRQALDTASKYGYHDIEKLAHLSLSYVALLSGDHKAYRSHRDAFTVLNDSLISESVIRTSTEWETRYQTALKEKEIERLRQVSELRALKLRNQNLLIAGLAALVALSLLTGYLLMKNVSRKKLLAEKEIQVRQQQILQLEQEKQIAVSMALLQGQEKERSRLARDLHDGLGGMLSGIKQALSSMKGNQIITETGATAFNQVISDMDQSIQELRHIARNMMPEALVRFGLRDALQDYCAHLRESAGINVTFQSYGMDTRLEEQTEVILFRICQELLNNAVKHAKAPDIIVQLMRNENDVSLTVEDSGVGMADEKITESRGSGWINIRSRVDYLKGRIDVRSRPGEGTSVHIEIPLA